MVTFLHPHNAKNDVSGAIDKLSTAFKSFGAATSVLTGKVAETTDCTNEGEDDYKWTEEAHCLVQLLESLEKWHKKNPATRGNHKSAYFDLKLAPMVGNLKYIGKSPAPGDRYRVGPSEDLPCLLDMLKKHHKSQSHRVPISNSWNVQFLDRIQRVLAMDRIAIVRMMPSWFKRKKGRIDVD